MEFTEETAKQVAEKFGLDDKTIRVWKTRNSIPDRYFKEDYQHREKMDKSGKIEQLKVNRLIEVLSNPKLQTIAICKIAGITQKWLMNELTRSVDKRDGKVVYLSDTEYLSISNEIKKLRLEIKSILDGVESGSAMGTTRKKSFCRFIIEDPRIFREPIFSEKIGNKISAVKKLKQDHYLEFSPSEFDSMYNQLGILIFELQL
jgi:hypothetical protein